jgi:hypothetical protein
MGSAFSASLQGCEGRAPLGVKELGQGVSHPEADANFVVRNINSEI